MEKVVYLDNAATTACAPEVLAVMVEALSGACGNPSSHYSVGYEAKEFVDAGRAQVAKAINASPAEIFFTGCGSEADNWAVKGSAFTKARQNKKHLITSAFEHHAIMHSMAALERLGFEVTYIKPTAEGYIRPEDVEAAIRPDTALVSIMMAECGGRRFARRFYYSRSHDEHYSYQALGCGRYGFGYCRIKRGRRQKTYF